MEDDSDLSVDTFASNRSATVSLSKTSGHSLAHFFNANPYGNIELPVMTINTFHLIVHVVVSIYDRCC